MANMIVIYRIMPEDGDIEYSRLEEATKNTINSYNDSVKIKEIGAVGVGFGLQAVKVKFQINEECGSEELENKLKGLHEVGDVTVELMDRL